LPGDNNGVGRCTTHVLGFAQMVAPSTEWALRVLGGGGLLAWNK
jgi:hypothetical protein